MIQERFSALNKSDKMSLICTAFFWFAFVILSVLIPVQKNNPPEYVSVKLQLLQEPVPAKQNQNVSSEEIKPSSKPLEETAVKESTKIIEETPQKIEKKETVAVVKTEKPVVEKTIEKTVTETKPLVKSVEQLMEENSSVIKKQKDVSEVDWDSLFADDSAVSSSYSAVSETKDVNYENQSSISGTAGSAFIANETLQTSSADNQNTDNSAVMESTVSALNKIATKNFSENSAGGIQYTVTAETSQNAMDLSETGTPMLTAEGKMRLLLIPEKPVILISPEKPFHPCSSFLRRSPINSSSPVLHAVSRSIVIRVNLSPYRNLKPVPPLTTPSPISCATIALAMRPRNSAARIESPAKRSIARSKLTLELGAFFIAHQSFLLSLFSGFSNAIGFDSSISYCRIKCINKPLATNTLVSIIFGT